MWVQLAESGIDDSKAKRVRLAAIAWPCLWHRSPVAHHMHAAHLLAAQQQLHCVSAAGAALAVLSKVTLVQHT